MNTIQEVRQYFDELLKNKSIYVWGFDSEIITKESIDHAYNTYHSSTYNREYYDKKLIEGEGRIGADCSGCLYPLSECDNTANGYYTSCKTKGSISSIPKTVPCLVFMYNTIQRKMVHVGMYTGDGYVTEMRSSSYNVRRYKLSERPWTHWGQPNWIDYNSSQLIPINLDGQKYLALKDIGENVKALQIDLIALGYNLGKFGADGEFGSKTDSAVREFQKKYGLTVDGKVGEKTINKITNLLK